MLFFRILSVIKLQKYCKIGWEHLFVLVDSDFVIVKTCNQFVPNSQDYLVCIGACVCMGVWVCTGVCVCMGEWVCMAVHVYGWVSVYRWVCVYRCMRACVRVDGWVSVWVWAVALRVRDGIKRRECWHLVFEREHLKCLHWKRFEVETKFTKQRKPWTLTQALF